jgi:2-keto-4-pentenoate hydratase/2-oxohepta-3-ene-1,7-dioic acid hydratase in catechol pathway
MKYTRFQLDGQTLLGALVGDGELAELGAGDSVIDVIGADPSTADRLPLEAVRLLAPVARPPKSFGIGLNDIDHIEESGRKDPAHLVVFNKQSTCVIGPHVPIHVPRASTMVDYEGELGVVIGRRCRHVPADQAHEVVAGCVVVNDVSVRDWQQRMPHDDARQVIRHPRAHRSMARHGRRDGRSAPAKHPHLGQRRTAPGRQHRRHGVRRVDADRDAVHRVHPRAG